jgi:hypothetical protein
MGLIQCPNCQLGTPEASNVCIHCRSTMGASSPGDSFSTAEEQQSSSQAPLMPPLFFAVSLLKFAVLSVCTLGIYHLYWFYKNWQLIRVRDQCDISPFWRAFFAMLFCYPCFVRIKLAGAARDIGGAPPFGVLAILWMLFELAWRLPGPLGLLSFLSVGFLLPVQTYVNRINVAAAPTCSPNSRFTSWNWIAVVLGGPMVALAVAGSFIPAK